MSNQFDPFQIVIVGAGISGLVLAERYAKMGKKVLIIEKREHIGGNCYDYINEYGLLVSKYGAHIFHTNHNLVWDYVNMFSLFSPYTHKVKAFVNGKIVPIPVNIETVNSLLGEKISNQAEMDKWLLEHQIPAERPKNSEEVGLSRVGRDLYDLLFKPYTIKQWSKDPIDLDPLVLSRIPVRNSFDERYFTDKYQAQPINGFTKLFEKMISHRNIRVLLNTDFLKIKGQLSSFEKLFYTGPIDQYFGKDGQLEYRSLKFKFDTYNTSSYQQAAVINYPIEHEFTRIVEYKKITGQKHPQTTVSREYPTWTGEPYYPVPTWENRQKYKSFQSEVKRMNNIYFIGRLAEYRYINMDEAFLNALRLFSRLEGQDALEF